MESDASVVKIVVVHKLLWRQIAMPRTPDNPSAAATTPIGCPRSAPPKELVRKEGSRDCINNLNIAEGRNSNSKCKNSQTRTDCQLARNFREKSTLTGELQVLALLATAFTSQIQPELMSDRAGRNGL